MIKKLQKKIRPGEAYLITNKFNVRYLTGFTGTNGQLFLTKSNAYFLTDFRYSKVAKKILPPYVKLIETARYSFEEIKKISGKHKVKKIFFEEKDLTYSDFKTFKKGLRPTKLMPCADFVESLRVIKSPQEINLITKAQRISEKIFLEIRKKLKPGKTEQEIAFDIEQLAHKYGADGVSFPPIIAFGANSGIPHHQTSNKKLKKGDLVLIDMGMKYKGYCSDMTRVVFTKKPTPKQKEIYNLVLTAQETAIKKLKAKTPGKTADNFARSMITKAGYGKNFGHSLGHGIGLEIHESPRVAHNSGLPIPENTIVTVEPGIYLENSFGIRIEDMVLVRRDSVRNLTKVPKKIEDAVL